MGQHYENDPNPKPIFTPLKIDGLGDRLWSRSQGHLEAESLKPLDGTSLNGFSVSLIEVVVSKILIVLAARDEIVAGNEETVGYSYGSALLATAPNKPMIHSLVVLVLGARCAVGSFGQRPT
jgi:hypothetical protein